MTKVYPILMPLKCLNNILGHSPLIPPSKIHSKNKSKPLKHKTPNSARTSAKSRMRSLLWNKKYKRQRKRKDWGRKRRLKIQRKEVRSESDWDHIILLIHLILCWNDNLELLKLFLLFLNYSTISFSKSLMWLMYCAFLAIPASIGTRSLSDWDWASSLFFSRYMVRFSLDFSYWILI